MDSDLFADVFEAIEFMKLMRPVYLEVLKQTGSRDDAIEAVRFLKKIMEEENGQAH